MWLLGQIQRFDRAYRATDLTWDPSDSPISLRFPEGLFFALVLVTPFWITVGLLFHLLTS